MLGYSAENVEENQYVPNLVSRFKNVGRPINTDPDSLREGFGQTQTADKKN